MKRSAILIAILTLTSCEHPKDGSYGKDGHGTGDYSKPPADDSEFGILFGDKFDPEAVKKFCLAEKCSVGLLLGGQIDETKFKDVNVRFFGALGPKNRSKVKSNHYEIPGDFYSMDAGWINFYALDTPGFNKDDEQVKWLSDVLTKGNPTWRVAYGYHKAENFLDKYIDPLFEKSAVDFYLFAEGVAPRLVARKGKTSHFTTGNTAGFGHLLLSPKAGSLRWVDGQGKVSTFKEFKKP